MNVAIIGTVYKTWATAQYAANRKNRQAKQQEFVVLEYQNEDANKVYLVVSTDQLKNVKL